ncbi:hemolysin XhlA [Sodalis ligni]|uniref:hemolysin XhlA n=1 Tax=Sodalis ligni TaxID=2697027 RepID=UPI001BDF2FDD|nr:hemolysin XhlA [Sodalis ligni]QWA09824.1 hemolysin XhlA [Sodalis ligni]
MTYDNAQSGSGKSGGGNDMQSRIAKLESDVSYIRRDIDELKLEVKSVDKRLSNIEAGITSMKTTLKATGVVMGLVFAFCTYVFGSYVSRILDALNGLVLK